MEPSWPEWGASPPPYPYYEKQYFRGTQGDMHAGEVLYEKDDIKVLRCHPCIAIHLCPLSIPKELARYYHEQIYSDAKPAYLEQHNADRTWWLATHRTIFDAIQSWLPDGKIGVLDVGAGPGFPLQVAQERGYDTLGIEPSPVAADYIAKKIGSAVFHGTLAAYWEGTYRHKTWQMAYAWEVLEHQPNPEEFLLQCYDLLVPGGVLVVAVPSDFTQGQAEACQRFHLPPWYISAPDHQHYFTPITLKLMLRRCGFHIRYVRMTAPLIEHFMLEEGICYVGDPLLGRRCHLERMCAELAAIKDGTWPALEAEYVANVERRVGREVIMVATKN